MEHTDEVKASFWCLLACFELYFTAYSILNTWLDFYFIFKNLWSYMTIYILMTLVFCWWFILLQEEHKDTYFLLLLFCCHLHFFWWIWKDRCVTVVCFNFLVVVRLPSHMLQLVNMLHLRQKSLFALICVSHPLQAMGLFLLINSFLLFFFLSPPSFSSPWAATLLLLFVKCSLLSWWFTLRNN